MIKILFKVKPDSPFFKFGEAVGAILRKVVRYGAMLMLLVFKFFRKKVTPLILPSELPELPHNDSMPDIDIPDVEPPAFDRFDP